GHRHQEPEGRSRVRMLMPLPSEVQSLLGSELEPGERLLWSGIPRQGPLLRPADAMMIPFSLMWGGFAIFWEYSVVHGGAPFFFALWGIPFVLVGLYLIFGRFFYDSFLRARTWYALSDDRAIIISGAFTRQLQSIKLKTLSEVTMDERADGSGNIRFGPAGQNQFAWSGAGWPGTRGLQTPC